LCGSLLCPSLLLIDDQPKRSLHAAARFVQSLSFIVSNGFELSACARSEAEGVLAD
jgi:hypothetical protein